MRSPPRPAETTREPSILPTPIGERLRADHFVKIDKHCLMCGKIIPRDHPRYRLTLTDTDECSPNGSMQWRKSREDQRQCRYCKKPSTPAQRARFSRWKRYEEEEDPPPDSELDPSGDCGAGVS